MDYLTESIVLACNITLRNMEVKVRAEIIFIVAYHFFLNQILKKLLFFHSTGVG